MSTKDLSSVDDLNDDKMIVDDFTWYHQTRKKVGGKKRNHYLGRSKKAAKMKKRRTEKWAAMLAQWLTLVSRDRKVVGSILQASFCENEMFRRVRN